MNNDAVSPNCDKFMSLCEQGELMEMDGGEAQEAKTVKFGYKPSQELSLIHI